MEYKAPTFPNERDTSISEGVHSTRTKKKKKIYQQTDRQNFTNFSIENVYAFLQRKINRNLNRLNILK